MKDKDRANFCDYFQPRPGAFVAPEHGAAHQAHADLQALFGIGAASDDQPQGGPVHADESLAKLQQLFSDDADDKE